MSDLESVFCRTPMWRVAARRLVVPRVLEGPVGPRVLEIGCGSGAMAVEVLRARRDVTRYVATDVDPAMVELASRQLADLGERAEARQVDATGLPYEDATFDTVCSWLMLHHTIEWERVVADAVRVLRPGGRFVGYDLPDSRLSRAVHTLTRSEVRMIAADDLVAELGRLGMRELVVEPLGVAGAYRFSATR
ncbi:class I SAM-dependent methyltransferase [Aeromicrobium sp. Leaf350]|uniref:class I SAM-dependent methyltransferase n=1 Tax=Aeromicrobium sp. Leaf350 TaxID=2876565 RepID=UPI001E30E7CD|nr:class I SAM-dependent methyltransferase [Aeromicrobium sp. Leaf350]